MLFFIPLISAIILKAAEYDLYVGKPSRNILAMVKNADDALKLYLRKGSSSNKTSYFVQMKTDHYMGINRKNQISMNGHSWGLPKTNWKFVLNISGSLSIVSNEICLGFRPGKKELKPVSCKEKGYDINFTVLDGEKVSPADKGMMEIEFGGDANLPQSTANMKFSPEPESERSDSQSGDSDGDDDQASLTKPRRKFVKYSIKDLYKHL